MLCDELSLLITDPAAGPGASQEVHLTKMQSISPTYSPIFETNRIDNIESTETSMIMK